MAQQVGFEPATPQSRISAYNHLRTSPTCREIVTKLANFN